ncbi:ABC-type antimicrobial peptide transport system, permease component [Lachnospiraceae bacterium NE2001]|nr:ABC-type antimicrobial peptide transport system, permease component [Lachnospiraceae bacterium NE2001]
MGYIIRLSLANLKQRKLRTILTVLGIMIGIMSIVTMLTAGMGAKAALVDEIEMSWDTRMIIVSSLDTTRKDMLITDAVVTKLEKLDKVSAVYPVLQANGREKMGNFYGYDSILGVPTEYLEVLGAKEGSLPTRNGARPELLMGTGFRRALYNDKTWMPFSESSKAEMSFIGKKIDFLPEKIDSGYATSTDADKDDVTDDDKDETSVKLTVVGETGNEYDYNIYTDIDTLKLYLKRQYPEGKLSGQPVDKDGNPYSGWAYNSAYVYVEDKADVERVSKVIENMGFHVENNLETLESVNRTINMVQMILGAIGLIAGIVAIIGIINTMMTAVYDRIREIGLLKMIGADSDDISLMFLFESALLGGVGGALGIGLSFLIDLVINKKLVEMMQMEEGTWLMATPLWLIALSLVLSIIVSMLAGAFPAHWAARVKPLDAIAA